MFNRLTVRQKEILTGLCGLTLLLGLFAGSKIPVDIEQLPFIGMHLAEKQQQSFDRKMKNAFYTQPGTGLRLAIPGAKYFPVQFNSRGFRGPELDDPLDPDVIHIGYMGSSLTLDRFSTPDENSWPALTTQYLGQAFPGCQFTYQNAGIPGANSRKLVAMYKEVISGFKPDIVVVMTDDRKATLKELASQSGVRAGPEDALDFTRDELLSQYKQDLPHLLDTIKKSDAIPVLLSFSQVIRENQSSEEQSRLVQRGGLSRLPFMSVEKFLRSAKWYNEINQEVAAAKTVTYIDWHGAVPGTRQNFLDLRHFKPRGSARLAEVLAEKMKNSPLFTKELVSTFGCAKYSILPTNQQHLYQESSLYASY